MTKLLQYAKYVALPLALLVPLAAQDQGITRQQADQILNELRQIRQLLEKQQAAKPQGPAEPGRATLNLEGSPMLGSKDAPVTMVEYTDYQCPYCRQFHLTVFNELKKNFIDTGKVRFYSRDLPLDSLHPNATRAAQAARCAADQGQFWTMRNLMGLNPDKLDMDHLAGFATDLKLDTFAFRNCVESEKYKSAVESDVLEAVRIGAQATPSFVIGKSTSEGVDGELMIGALPYPSFEQKLKLLETAK
ncbi:MAG: thioredoxin domain-containing protein [Bryobacteraceae bacterium]